MGKLSQLHGRKPYRVLVHPHGHQGDAGQLVPCQPAIGANPASLPEPAVRAGGTRVGGWSCPGHTSRGSSLGAAEEGSYTLTRSAHRARCWKRLSND